MNEGVIPSTYYCCITAFVCVCMWRCMLIFVYACVWTQTKPDDNTIIIYNQVNGVFLSVGRQRRSLFGDHLLSQSGHKQKPRKVKQVTIAFQHKPIYRPGERDNTSTIHHNDKSSVELCWPDVSEKLINQLSDDDTRLRVILLFQHLGDTHLLGKTNDSPATSQRVWTQIANAHRSGAQRSGSQSHYNTPETRDPSEKAQGCQVRHACEMHVHEIGWESNDICFDPFKYEYAEHQHHTAFS